MGEWDNPLRTVEIAFPQKTIRCYDCRKAEKMQFNKVSFESELDGNH